MENLEQIKSRLTAAVPEARLEIVANGSAAAQPSLLVDSAHAQAVAQFLRDDSQLRLDHVSNATGVDWPESVVVETVRRRQLIGSVEREVEVSVPRRRPGYLEVVYHLYSMALGHGPVILRQRTINRLDQVQVTSLTPVFRGAEFQEREVYDLFGVVFEGHPDLRRILMWDEFQDYPMRKDYVAPDDYEYEPTPHGEVLNKARRHKSVKRLPEVRR